MYINMKEPSVQTKLNSGIFTGPELFKINIQGSHRSGKSGEMGFSAKIREKNFKNQGNFSKSFSNLLNLRKMVFKTVKPHELSGNCSS